MKSYYNEKFIIMGDMLDPYEYSVVGNFYKYIIELDPSHVAEYEAEQQKVKNWRIESSKKGPNSCKFYNEVVPMEEVHKLEQVNNAKLNWYNKFLKNS